MIRLSNLTLPLDHPPEALEAAVCERLGIAPADLLRCTLARRGNDARKKTAIKLVYSLDLDLADEALSVARPIPEPAPVTMATLPLTV